MALNKYFNKTNNNDEQNLYKDLMEEYIQTFGIDVIYVPRTNVEIDNILGEATKTIYDRGYVIEMVMPDNGASFQSSDLMSKFGFQSNWGTDLLVMKDRFNSLGIPDYIRPQEGDLIYVGDFSVPEASYINTLFEINEVKYDDPGFQLGEQFCYRLICETFTLENERVETGFEAIDDVSDIINSSINDDNVEESEDLIPFNENNLFKGF